MAYPTVIASPLPLSPETSRRAHYDAQAAAPASTLPEIITADNMRDYKIVRRRTAADMENGATKYPNLARIMRENFIVADLICSTTVRGKKAHHINERIDARGRRYFQYVQCWGDLDGITQDSE